MVKFGRHIETYAQEFRKTPPFLSTSSSSSIPPPTTLYIVPYNTIKKNVSNTPLFFQEWKENLDHYSADFHNSMTSFWLRIFSKISHLPESRGAIPDVALQMYIECVGIEGSRELLSWTSTVQEMSLMNAEALRKLAKKHDKLKMKQTTTTTTDGEGESSSSSRMACKELLPLLYASNFVIGQNLLETGLMMLRTHLEIEEEEDDDVEEEKKEQTVPEDIFDDDDENNQSTALYGGFSSFSGPPILMKKRLSTSNLRSAFNFLRYLVESTPPPLLSHLVSHRGYHCSNDSISTGRPLENSQSAYESAWTAGISLCECDVAITKDKKLILAHDEDFSRLSLGVEGYTDASQKVGDLTLKDIMSLPLKSGSRPPLLIDVLRSAHNIGDHAKLIIEIKPGNAGAATSVARMLIRHPTLMKHCAVIMSFDLFVMHNLRKELQIWIDEQQQQEVSVPPRRQSSFPTRLSLGNLQEMHKKKKNGKIRPSINLTDLTVEENDGPLHKKRSTSYMYNSNDYFGLGHNMANDVFHHVQAHPHAPTDSHHAPTTTTTTVADITTPPLLPSIPKLLLLTVAKKPKHPCKLQLNITSPSASSKVRSWLQARDGTGSLDGIYVQYEDSMKTSEGQAALRHLTTTTTTTHSSSSSSSSNGNDWVVGVWGNKTSPDDFETFRYLVEDCGVTYVNTDMPRDFKRGGSSIVDNEEE